MEEKVAYKDDIFHPVKLLPYSGIYLDIKISQILQTFPTFVHKPNKLKLEQEIEKVFIKKNA